jgi:hypothetical protein
MQGACARGRGPLSHTHTLSLPTLREKPALAERTRRGKSYPLKAYLMIIELGTPVPLVWSFLSARPSGLSKRRSRRQPHRRPSSLVHACACARAPGCALSLSADIFSFQTLALQCHRQSATFCSFLKTVGNRRLENAGRLLGAVARKYPIPGASVPG